MQTMDIVKPDLTSLQQTERELWKAIEKCQKAEIALGGEPVRAISGSGSPMRQTTTRRSSSRRRRGTTGRNGTVSYEQALAAFRDWNGGNVSHFAEHLGVSRATAKNYLDRFTREGYASQTGTGNRKTWKPAATLPAAA